MLLFIDRLPFYRWLPGGGGTGHWSVSVPALVTEHNVTVPPSRRHAQRWRIDTGCTSEAFGWRAHLLAAGLDPRRNTAGTSQGIFGLGSVQEGLRIRKGDVWLFSNIPALRDEPFRLPLRSGISFINRDLPGDPRLTSPVIGMQALRRAGVKVRLDCANDTLSLWVPASWLRSLRATVQRALMGFRRLPITWRD